MSLKQEEILENGYWEGSKPTSRLYPIVRTLTSNLDVFRPLLLKKVESSSKPLRRTAYLDGLRGFAAFLVYWHHHELWAHDGTGQNPIFENAYGYEKKHRLATFHGFRTFFTGGHFAVSIFFVLSAYALSLKAISLIHAGEYLKLGDSLASSLFRRWLRLYIPLICTTLAYMTLWHAFGIWTAASEPAGSWRDEVWKWYAEFKNFSFIFRTGGEPWFTYNFHLWSIPVEFKGSIVVYTVLVALSRCTKNARLLCEAGLIFYFLYIADGWFCAMFVAGTMLCELDALAEREELPGFFYKLESFKELIFYNFFAISIYLGGVPSQTLDVLVLRKSPGWYWLSFLKPQAVFDYKWFFLFWAAVLMVSSVTRISWLKRFFETRFNQYLGRIAFALYLVHGPVLWMLGDRIYAAVGWSKESYATTLPQWYNKLALPKFGPLGLEFSFLLPHLILLPVTLWTAELATKLFDEPSVKFAAWVYGKTLPRPPK